MKDKFQSIIKENMNVRADETILVAFSGGMDSVVLLDLFLQIRQPIILAHYNHGLRENADRDELFSKETARMNNLIFFSEKGNVTQFAEEKKLSIEESARIARYRFLTRIARENNIHLIATAHHADDQVETVLMHLFRGSGMKGLTGMRGRSVLPEFDDEIQIIRPLLSFWRKEIENYCHRNRLNSIEDETNESIVYLRNKIRNAILPILENEYPGLRQRILNLSSILQSEDELIEEYLDPIWQQLIIKEDQGLVRLDKSQFCGLTPAIKRRFIRRAVKNYNPAIKDLSFANIERLINFLDKGQPGKIDLHGDLVAFIIDKEVVFACRDELWVDRIYPQVMETLEIDSDLDKEFLIGNRWKIRFRSVNYDGSLKLSFKDPFHVCVDGELLSNKLILRAKKAGDRFQPLGFQAGTMKISDFFINVKIPEFARKNWPLLINASGDIIWVAGLQIDQKFSVKATTRKVMEIIILQD